MTHTYAPPSPGSTTRLRIKDRILHIAIAIGLVALAGIARAQITLSHMGTYATGQYDVAAAEIADFDPLNDRIWFSNAQNSITALNASNPASLTVFTTINMAVYGGGVNSVVVLGNGIAAAVEASPKTDPGKVVFFDLNGNFLNQVTVGALPDMLIATPDGTKLITANEGEPDNNYLIDPLGTVSIIDISGGLASLTNANVTTLDFSALTPAMLPGVRIFGPGASVAQDMEPEYVAVSGDSQWAFVTCQENNAVAKINLATNTITQVTALGYKDHSLAGNGLDASDSPASINIANWPVRGLYMPDAAHAFTIGGQTYVLYANEGDVREWTGTPGYVESLRVSNAAVVLDPTAFPNAATLKQNANLGRLNISKASGDTDNDGDYDALYSFGARSFSIRDANNALVYDSGDDLEQLTATAYPSNFNASNTNNTLDNRSDDKGPEPEALATGVIDGKTYAFVGLERVGGVVVFDVSNPFAPVFVTYLNNRNFGAATNTAGALDLGVEGITFVSAADSPNGVPMLITSNESSGTVSTFRILGCTVGASCDDGNPATVNDVYNASCQCVGTAPTFASGNVIVLQAGDGTGTLVNTGNPIVLREFTSTGTPGNTVTVPSTGGSAMIISGSATSEGNLSLSGDGTKLILSGYAQALPNATALAGSTSATINRAVGSVTASGAFTRNFTSSTFFSANNPRGAASDGTNFWGTGANQGVNYWGPSTAATIATGKSNTRSAAVFNGQLYISSASAAGTPAVTGIFAVGSGFPTTTGQTLSTIAATANTNTNGFFISPAGTTLYVTIGTGGIQKWVNTGSWTLAYTLTFTDGANAVVADFSGASPIIYAVSNTGASLLKITDPNSGSGSVPVTPQVIATAPANTAFRGISFAPCSPSTWYADTDGDGFGDPNTTAFACNQPVGYVANNTDLCPTNGSKQAPGVCGCGAADVPTTFYADTDGDGSGDPASPLASFTCIPPPSGYVSNNSDNCPTLFGVQGNACNDNNACTINDVITAACVCAGTPDNTDTDGDGIADCADNCPTFAGQQGDACNDNNACTINDLITAACVCAGTPDNTDTDGDGTADCADNCPTLAGQQGDACNDNNACTINDVITAGCVCAGTLDNTDTDGDGIADCADNCPNVTGQQGDACNDNNACTINDAITAACVCAGTPDNTDTDGDGIADCADNCPTLAGQQGDACNDNNACTINDVITAACVCAGTLDNTDTDGDGIADCADNCPNVAGQQGDACNDNNACTINDVITATCVCAGTPDNSDTDGDGLADCADNCPNVAGQVGSVCNDFNPCTINDVLNAGCQCVGTPNTTDTDGDGTPDCSDNCPNVPGQIGSACNDGNANTINDILNAGCQCEGTPVGGCTQNEVTLTLTTDSNGGETSYDVVLTGTNTVVCSGAGYASSSTITASCCLPNGCYDLRVFDSAGDGITAPGGYVLRDAANNRIIDNDANGAFFTTSSISPLGFCVPLGTGNLQGNSCDVLNATTTTVLQATPIPGVTNLYSPGTPTVNANTGYQFWVTNPNGGFSRRILFTHASPGTGWPTGTATAQKASYFKLSAMSSTPAIPQGLLLNVRVRALINGTYGVFGPACRLLLPVPPCQTTQLNATATPVVSCGATGLSLTSTIYADAVTGATNYQFEFAKSGYLRRITQATRSTALSFITSPLQNNNCYQVRVRISVDGGATFCPFGPVCNITIGTASCGSAMAPHADDNSIEDIALSTRLSIWPNPNDGSLLHVSLSDLDGSVNTVAVDVTDAYGKLVLNSSIPVQDGLLNSSIDLQHDLAPGLYLVNLQAGDQRYTERLVIQ